jgi:hypothetical protein
MKRGVIMKRIHLFEFTDQKWYPSTFRQMQTEYLQFAATLGSGHKNLIPLLNKALTQSSTTEIVDLCSGGSGPWMRLRGQLKQSGMNVNVLLTDKFPNPEALQKWSRSTWEGIKYLATPVDAMNVPVNLKGMRTLFEGFHHFRPEQAKVILKDAIEKNVAIGVFEASLKPPFGVILLLLSPIITIMTYMLITPFMKPVRLSRFIWTYLIPIVPLATSWDGVISLLRVYSTTELIELTSTINCDNYVWESGVASTGTPIFDFTYLIGYPTQEAKKSK